MQKPYKSCISVRCQEYGDHVYGAPAEDARDFVSRGLAVEVDEGKAFIGKIRLVLPLTELKNHLRPPQRSPKPPLRAPLSSTGDAGRGMTLIGRYRTVHLERQSALR